MKIILTGATGYVGEGVLLACLENENVEKVLSLSRRSTGRKDVKLEEYIVPDFLQLQLGDEKLQGYDAVFYCAGSSSVGMSQEQYKINCHDVPLHLAQVVKPKENMTIIFMSGAGTDLPLAWAKVKRSTEQALSKMGFKQTFGYRAGLMKPLEGQINRPNMIKATNSSYKIARFFCMGNTMENVAKSMIAATKFGYKKQKIQIRDIDILAEKL